MQENLYLIFDLNRDASEEEVDAAYIRLKAQYQEDRFLEGQEGHFAAKKLTELETAYEDIKYQFNQAKNRDNFGNLFLDVEQAVKAGELNKAQSMLDDIMDRGAEWHYYQSMIFYRKNWYSDSRKQLEICLELDPENFKYKQALDKLKQLMSGNPANGQGAGGNVPPQPNGQPDMQMGGCGTGLDCCSQLVCMNCLCNLCGGGC